MPPAPGETNSQARTLRCFMNWPALDGMAVLHPEPHPELDPARPATALAAIRDAGYEGVQLQHPFSAELLTSARALGLAVCGGARVNHPAEAAAIAREAAAAGLECVTLHVGWGMEDDAEAARLITAILDAQQASGVPLYPETHRATIFQDLWRTVQFVRQFPELRFNGDFSHWYTGSELVYGGFERKLDFIRPVISRVRFLHGRIGNPGCMQVALDDAAAEIATSAKEEAAIAEDENAATAEQAAAAQPSYVAHFRALWTAAFAGYLNDPAAPASIIFAPELLAPNIYYARTFPGPDGIVREESDRWQQSQVLVRIARQCFAAAAR